MRKILSILWFMVTIIAVIIAEYGGGYDRVTLAMGFLVLAFPSSILIYYVSFNYIYSLSNKYPTVNWRLLEWGLLILFGYFQWFILVPKLWKWFCNWFEKLKIRKNRFYN
ncbi:hypothetical protein CIK05_03885 [Bdellovibrio sp. qaytius]|nr:hypothetical protein CIK05_03885 [Bdellovibrio sp. qaytius]